MKAAAYFWIVSAILAWYRVTVMLMQEAWGPTSWVSKMLPVLMMPPEKKKPLVAPGLGEPGVRSAQPGVG